MPLRSGSPVLGLAALTLVAVLGFTTSIRAQDQPELTPATPPAGPTLRHAAAYLWRQQETDGGWHSETYGLLKSGQALTPFILHTLLNVPEDVFPCPADGVKRALQFLRRHTNEAGVLGIADADVLEYPNYSTAYALRCFVLAGVESDLPLIEAMRRHLAGEQFGPARGFDPGMPAFGGWGFGGTHPPGETGHMDLAHTRRVLQALREARLDDDEVFRRSQHFLRLVQRHPSDPRPQPLGSDVASGRTPYDGGFYFSPIVLGANKGRTASCDECGGVYFCSYATATCDGVLALLAAGVSPEDERVASAVSWLKEHARLDYPDGIPLQHAEPWGAAVHFYHLAVRAEVYAALGGPSGWQQAVAGLLARKQHANGSFVNTQSHLMKEDDPLLCTALGAIALSRSARTDSSTGE